jgi:hypothetical protein
MNVDDLLDDQCQHLYVAVELRRGARHRAFGFFLCSPLGEYLAQGCRYLGPQMDEWVEAEGMLAGFNAAHERSVPGLVVRTKAIWEYGELRSSDPPWRRHIDAPACYVEPPGLLSQAMEAESRFPDGVTYESVLSLDKIFSRASRLAKTVYAPRRFEDRG